MMGASVPLWVLSETDDTTRRVLVVDNEEHVLLSLQVWLTRMGWDTVCTRTVGEALKMSQDPTLSLALVDYRLLSGDDGIRLGRVLRQRRGIPFVLVSGYLRPTVVVDAMRAGALDVIEKPLTEEVLSDFFRRTFPSGASDAVGDKSSDLTLTLSDPVMTRWSKLILRACQSRRDPRTVSLWASSIAVSGSAIDETCRLCGVKAHASRDVARFLRALTLCKKNGSLLRSHFAVADKRTIERLFQRSGIPFNSRFISPQEFFRSQKLIERSKPCLHDLAHRTANSPLFF